MFLMRHTINVQSVHKNSTLAQPTLVTPKCASDLEDRSLSCHFFLSSLSILQRRGWPVLHLEFTPGSTSSSFPALTTCSCSLSPHYLPHFLSVTHSTNIWFPVWSHWISDHSTTREACDNWVSHRGESTLHAECILTTNTSPDSAPLAGDISPHLVQ